MTGKERILNAVYRKPIDRIPISMYEISAYSSDTHGSFANHEPSYANVINVMKAKTDNILLTGNHVHYPGIAKVTEVTSKRDGISTYTTVVLHTPKGDLTYRNRVDDNIHTAWTLEHYLKDLDDIEKYMSLDFTCKVNNDTMMKNKAELGDDGILCASVGDPVCRGAELFAMEDFLVYALTDTDVISKFLDFLWELTEFELKGMLTCDMTDVMVRICGPEYVTPPYMKTEYFGMFVTQYLAKMADMINDAGGISRVHSHGKIRHALTEFAKTNVMCVDPLEPIPDGDIDLYDIKRLYGDKFTLMGNIEIKDLEHAEPERIEQLVKEAIDIGKPGGGFILLPTATPINVPLSPKTEKNIITMIETAYEYGRY